MHIWWDWLVWQRLSLLKVVHVMCLINFLCPGLCSAHSFNRKTVEQVARPTGETLYVLQALHRVEETVIASCWSAKIQQTRPENHDDTEKEHEGTRREFEPSPGFFRDPY